MPLTAPLPRLLQRMRALPAPLRYAATVAIVLGIFLLRRLTDPFLPVVYPFEHFLIAVLLSAALFDRNAGFLATGLSVLLGAWFYLPPFGSLMIAEARDYAILAMFIGTSVVLSIIIETLHRALARLQRTHAELERAHAELDRSERARTLLLREFHHRTRNDLGSLVGLLMLRARTAPSPAAREGLLEAADHALALSRVHARLALDETLEKGAEGAWVDAHDFVTGLCMDLQASQCGEGLRPVSMQVEAEKHSLPTARAVPLGLVLNETVTNALKYAFPEDRPGTVRVRFLREDDEFVLTVADDGIGLPEEGDLDRAPPAAPPRGSGLGTRLLRALAAQLRGSFTRQPGPGGVGTVTELRFPAAPPEH